MNPYEHLPKRTKAILLDKGDISQKKSMRKPAKKLYIIEVRRRNWDDGEWGEWMKDKGYEKQSMRDRTFENIIAKQKRSNYKWEREDYEYRKKDLI